jgi:hypothetical protein
MLRTSLRPALAVATLTAFLFAATSGFAATVHYAGALKGASEVPPTTSTGSGTVKADFDTVSKKLSFEITYKGLTGPATAAHFHGPAAADANAGVALGIAPTMLASPIKGEATLTDAQAGDLAAGNWYFNVHTAANPKGEIRGQVTKK